MSTETLWKTLRNPGDHFFKLKKKSVSMEAKYKQRQGD